MKIALAIIGIVAILFIILFIISNEISTRRLRKHPKIGDRITFFIGEQRYHGIIYKIFKTHVRVRYNLNKWQNVKPNNIYVEII